MESDFCLVWVGNIEYQLQVSDLTPQRMFQPTNMNETTAKMTVSSNFKYEGAGSVFSLVEARTKLGAECPTECSLSHIFNQKR